MAYNKGIKKQNKNIADAYNGNKSYGRLSRVYGVDQRHETGRGAQM